MPGPDALTQWVVAPVPQHRHPRGLLDPVGEGEREPMGDHDTARGQPKAPMTSATDCPGPPAVLRAFNGDNLGAPTLHRLR